MSEIESIFPIIKVCGMKDRKNMQEVLEANPNWMGFIFFEDSPRHCSSDVYEVIRSIDGATKVGVFVNADAKEVIERATACELDIVQLHGEETPEVCAKIQEHFPIMKAISIQNVDDLEKTKNYEDCVDYFLFDTKDKQKRGGTGKQFDWNILQSYSGQVPFLLSGGISQNDVQHLLSVDHEQCIGFDVNSCFETQPGMKDANMLNEFISKMKEA